MKRPSKYVRILQYALERIATRKYSLICHAIHNSEGNRVDREKLKCWIDKQLSGSITYAGWVEQKNEHIFRLMSALEQRGQDPFREGRLQWLDWMIANVDKELK